MSNSIPQVTCDVCGVNSGIPRNEYWQFSLSGGRCNNCGKKMIKKNKYASPSQPERGQKPAGINDSSLDQGFL